VAGSAIAHGPPVEARALVKRYGHILAVDHVDLTVHAGDIYGFLGPNGAGKTTAMRMMLGLLTADEGSVRLFGRDPHTDLPRALDGVAGFVETPNFYPFLTGRKNLELFAALDGGGAAARIDEALELVELRDRASDKVGGYSQGMKQRLGLAASMIRDPRLLVLDEPTNGLDPAGIRDMRSTITGLSERGMTIFLSSHQLAEMEEICSQVAIIRSGSIVYEGALDDIRASVEPRYRLRTTDQARAMELCGAQRGIADVSFEGDDIMLTADEQAAIALSRALVESGLGIAALAPESATLESLFFELTEGIPSHGAAAA
jgi:ABC-2 type transport system ATP-binding protein